MVGAVTIFKDSEEKKVFGVIIEILKKKCWSNVLDTKLPQRLPTMLEYLSFSINPQNGMVTFPR